MAVSDGRTVRRSHDPGGGGLTFQAGMAQEVHNLRLRVGQVQVMEAESAKSDVVFCKYRQSLQGQRSELDCKIPPTGKPHPLIMRTAKLQHCNRKPAEAANRRQSSDTRPARSERTTRYLTGSNGHPSL